jgi:hypothetical protein
MGDLEQKNIIITSVEFTTWGLKVTDEKGLKYNVPEFKKDTKDVTVAYKTLSELPKNGVGLNKCFKFAVVPNQHDGQSRYVRIISEPEEAGEKSTYVSPSMQQAKPVKIEKGTDWDEINEKKDKSIKWLNALNNSCLLASTGKIELTAIKATAEKIYQMHPIGTPENKVAPVELPIIQREEVTDFGDMQESVDQPPF